MIVIHGFDSVTGSSAPCSSDNYYNFVNNKLSKIASLYEEMVDGSTDPPTWNCTINNKKTNKSTYDLAIARYIDVPANAKGLDVYQSYLDKFFANVPGDKYATLSLKTIRMGHISTFPKKIILFQRVMAVMGITM